MDDNNFNQDGFYTKSSDDIIQDEPLNNSSYSGEFYTPPSNNGYYNPAVKPKQKKKYSLAVVLLSALLAAAVGAGSSIAVMIFAPNYSNASPNTGISQNKVNINIDETAESVVEAVAKKVTPSVVGIRTTASVANFFGGQSESSGEGSGVVYSTDGYIITNYHVISSAATGRKGARIEVFLDADSTEPYSASVVGYNISADIAVIKIDAESLTAVEIASSDDLRVGQYVITVGNPGGLEFMDSVTYGVISGLNRVVSADSGVELIQTDAAINPGNSGGALVNTKGELVGINSSKIVSEEFEGMGFAIPSNTVVEICKNIIDKENSPEPYVGITISSRYTGTTLKAMGYPTGAVISSVADSSPAEDAGLARGDIITEFGGKEITNYTVLEDLISSSTPGAEVEVKVYRNGNYGKTKITIGSNNQVD